MVCLHQTRGVQRGRCGAQPQFVHFPQRTSSGCRESGKGGPRVYPGETRSSPSGDPLQPALSPGCGAVAWPLRTARVCPWITSSQSAHRPQRFRNSACIGRRRPIAPEDEAAAQVRISSTTARSRTSRVSSGSTSRAVCSSTAAAASGTATVSTRCRQRPACGAASSPIYSAMPAGGRPRCGSTRSRRRHLQQGGSRTPGRSARGDRPADRRAASP